MADEPTPLAQRAILPHAGEAWGTVRDGRVYLTPTAESALRGLTNRTGTQAQNYLRALFQSVGRSPDVADGFLQLFVQAEPPTPTDSGDRWFDSNDDFRPYIARRGVGGILEWVDASTDPLSIYYRDILRARRVADGRARAYFTTTEPPGPHQIGDLWHNPDDPQRRTLQWDGTQWVNIADVTEFNTSADTNAVAGRPAQTVLNDLDEARAQYQALEASVDEIIADVTSLDTSVAGLIETYGTTASSAASALAAQQAEAAAVAARNASQSARDASQAAQGLAETARTQAQAARDAASGSAADALAQAQAAAGSAGTAAGHATTATTRRDEAAGSASAAAASALTATSRRDEAAQSATAAATSATAAATSATDAGTAASAAAADRLAAQTARGGAESARDASVAARDTAQGHAASASQSATLAAGSATTAGGSATAAAGSATAAATSATNAGNSASAAASSALTATSRRDEAAQSATAAATSATNAATSATNAEASATASQASRLAAETARGGAETAQAAAVSARDTASGHAATATTQSGLAATSATAASGSATAAAGSATTATTQAGTATTQAGIATQARIDAEAARGQAAGSASAASGSAAAASGSAAAAASSATLAANVGAASNNRDPVFALWNSASDPRVWSVWNGTVERVAGRFSDYAARQTSNGTTEHGLGAYATASGDEAQPALNGCAPGWYVLLADVTHEWGENLQGAGLYVYAESGSAAAINFGADADVNGTVWGATFPTNGRNLSFSKLVHLPTIPAGQLILHPMTDWGGFSATRRARQMTWHRAMIRPATDTEIARGVAEQGQGALSAQLAALRAVDTDLQANKASAAALDTLSAEIANARGGQPNVSARLAQLDQARADGDAALSSRATALEAANNSPNPNFFPNPSGNGSGLAASNFGWQGPSGFVAARLDQLGGNHWRWSGGATGELFSWFDIPVSFGGDYVLSAVTFRSAAVNAWIWLDALNGSGSNIGNSYSLGNGHIQMGAAAARGSIFIAAPADTRTIRVVIKHEASAAGDWNARQFKLEIGRTPTAYSEEAHAGRIEARVAAEETARASAVAAEASARALLSAEITNARAGQATLLARLGQIDTARADGDAALSSRATALEARVSTRPNLLRNAGFAGGLSEWNAGANWFYVATDGGYAACVTNGTNLLQQFSIPVAGGTTYTLAIDALVSGMTAGSLTADFMWRDAGGALLVDGQNLFATPNIGWHRASVTQQAPTGATQCDVRIFTEGATFSGGGIAAVRLPKLEAGSAPSVFTNDRAAADLSASVTTNAQAIATINGAAAFLEQIVAASGGDLAAFRMRAGQGGSFIELVSTVLRLANVSNGAVIEVMRAIAGEAYFSRPISSDFGGRRLTIGPGYGVAGSEVTFWFGPATIAPASQSRTNGHFSFGTDGQVYYGSAVLGGGTSGGVRATSTVSNSTNAGDWVTVARIAWGSVSTSGRWRVTAAVATDSGTGITGGGDFVGEIRVIETGTGGTTPTGDPLGVGSFSTTGAAPLIGVSVEFPADQRATVRATGARDVVMQVRRASGSNTLTAFAATLDAEYIQPA